LTGLPAQRHEHSISLSAPSLCRVGQESIRSWTSRAGRPCALGLKRHGSSQTHSRTFGKPLRRGRHRHNGRFFLSSDRSSAHLIAHPDQTHFRVCRSHELRRSHEPITWNPEHAHCQIHPVPRTNRRKLETTRSDGRRMIPGVDRGDLKSGRHPERRTAFPKHRVPRG